MFKGREVQLMRRTSSMVRKDSQRKIQESLAQVQGESQGARVGLLGRKTSDSMNQNGKQRASSENVDRGEHRLINLVGLSDPNDRISRPARIAEIRNIDLRYSLQASPAEPLRTEGGSSILSHVNPGRTTQFRKSKKQG